MKTFAEHLADIRPHVSRGQGNDYAVAIGKIDAAINVRQPGATDAQVLAEIKDILAALTEAQDTEQEV